MTELLPSVAGVPLVDHHCHGLVRTDPDRTAFEQLLTEAATVSPLGTTLFDSLIGLAVRRWCAPVLDLRNSRDGRRVPGPQARTRCGRGQPEIPCGDRDHATSWWTAATDPDQVTTAAELADLAGARAHDVIRLEALAEEVVDHGTTPTTFARDCAEVLAQRARTAVGAKSISAYRVGLRLPGERPGDAEVEKAAADWLSHVDRTGDTRLRHPTSTDSWSGWRWTDDSRSSSTSATATRTWTWPSATHSCSPTCSARRPRPSVPIMLLHNYPFHRHAAYLAQVFPHVFVDVGLATHNTGLRAGTVIAETLELVPFGKVLFSTDAFGLAELYHLGTHLFRAGLSAFLRTALDADELTTADATRIANLIGHVNARRVYRLDD